MRFDFIGGCVALPSGATRTHTPETDLAVGSGVSHCIVLACNESTVSFTMGEEPFETFLLASPTPKTKNKWPYFLFVYVGMLRLGILIVRRNGKMEIKNASLTSGDQE